MRASAGLRIQPVPPLLVPLACALALFPAGSDSVALRYADLSAAEAVALRFPDNWDSAPAVPRVLVAAIAASRGPRDGQFGWFSPEPMMPPVAPQRAEAPVAPAVAVPMKEAKTVPAARRVFNRPGYMLNDSQIASIKARLHLTADQERMWPTVEAALRRMAYGRGQDAHARGNAASQTASVDPESVLGLKSAAVPLLLSFNAEQKEEVRNLVHVMGLDQVASQF